MKRIWILMAAVMGVCGSSLGAVDWTAAGHGVSGVSVAANSDTELEVTLVESTSFHYIADPTIGGELRRTDSITMSFELEDIWMESGYDGDAVIGLSEIDGATSAGTYQLGLRIMDPFGGLPATVRVYPFIKYQGAVLLEGALSLDTNVNWGIGLTWTPTGGSYGYGKFTLAATNLTTLAVQTSAAHPQNNNLGFSGTAWGVFGGLQNSTDTEVLRFKVTNPTYTQLDYPAALPANMRLWIPFGQSNAHGNNGSETNHWPANTYEQTNTFRWINGRWCYARVGAAIHNDTAAWTAFASALAAQKGYAVGIIDNTRGGTALTQWLPAAGVMYPILTNAVITAMAALTTPVLEGVLHQAGESDAGNATDAGNFGSNFATVMTALRTDLGTPGLTNIVTRLHNWSESLNAVNVATIRGHQEAQVHWIDLDDLNPGGSFTNGAGHLDIDGQLAVGQRMAMKRFAMLDGAAPAVAAANASPAWAATAAALAARSPANLSSAFVPNVGFMVYDANSAWPTNSDFSCVKPVGRLGRWRVASVVPGMTARQMLDLAYLNLLFETKANTNAFETTQFDVSRNAIGIKSGAVLTAPVMTNFLGSEWRPFSNSNPSHGIMRANGTGYIVKVDGGNSRVGIGTDAPTPQAKLHVHGTGGEDLFRVDDVSNDMQLIVQHSSTPGAGSVDFLSEGADATAGFSWSTPPGRMMTLSRDGALAVTGAITSGGLAVPTRTTTVKVGDQSVTSSTTFVDITGLPVAMVANGTYKFRAVVYFIEAGTTAGIRVTMNGPAAPTTLNYSVWFQNQASTIIPGQTPSTAYGSIHNVGINAAAALRVFIVEGLVVNGANAGNLAVQFAQNVSDGNATTVKAGSYFEVEKL